MATKVNDIIDQADLLLVNIGNTRWSKEELLGWFNAGVAAVVKRRPDVNVINTTFVCAQSTRQELSANALRLVDVHKNVAGIGIQSIDRDSMDTLVPNWHDDSEPTDEVTHFLYDDRQPKAFYLYPCPKSGHQINISYSAAPAPVVVTDFVNGTQESPLNSAYDEPILDFMIYRACSKDSEFSNSQRAMAHFQAFQNALSDKTNADTGMSPNNG